MVNNGGFPEVRTVVNGMKLEVSWEIQVETRVQIKETEGEKVGEVTVEERTVGESNVVEREEGNVGEGNVGEETVGKETVGERTVVVWYPVIERKMV